jgi:hypothetical protein
MCPDYDGSVAGWLAGDTLATCGDTPGVCSDFLTGIDSFSQNAGVSTINTSGVLQSASSPSSAPEPRYWGLLVLCVGFTAIRKRRYES